MDKFSSLLGVSDNFLLRRAVERLREGLFDPFAVQLLTARETKLNKVFDDGVKALGRKELPHLCICGSYGQGKSHSLTYLRERALGQGFATSFINLDPREIPFHDFRQVYRALVENIRFPDSDATLAQYWKKWNREHAGMDCIPDSMPFFFKTILTALANKNLRLSPKQKKLKKHTTFRPSEFPWILANALKGERLPVFRLRHALKYREVSFYKEASLVCKGWEPYYQAVCSLAEMFQNMGLKGWVLFFDEGESIIQRPINIRRKSYAILDHFFAPTSSQAGLYPIFAFTNDFFMQVRGEEYDRVVVKNEQERPYFEKNYGELWKRLTCYNLHDLRAQEWQDLLDKLINLHAEAYGWKPSPPTVAEIMTKVAKATSRQETRLQIKALITYLDIAQQEVVLGCAPD